MIGEHDEFQSGARCRCGDVIRTTEAVGPIGMNVESAADGPVVEWREDLMARRDRGAHKNDDGGRDDRRCECEFPHGLETCDLRLATCPRLPRRLLREGPPL